MAKYVSFEELSKQEQKALKKAKRFLLRACTRGEFLVGAALITIDNKIIPGVNVDISGVAPICAETAALVHAVIHGFIKQSRAIAIVTKTRAEPTKEISRSCGRCLQFMCNIAAISGVAENFKIITATTDLSRIFVYTIGESLPLPYEPYQDNPEPPFKAVPTLIS